MLFDRAPQVLAVEVQPHDFFPCITHGTKMCQDFLKNLFIFFHIRFCKAFL